MVHYVPHGPYRTHRLESIQTRRAAAKQANREAARERKEKEAAREEADRLQRERNKIAVRLGERGNQSVELNQPSTIQNFTEIRQTLPHEYVETLRCPAVFCHTCDERKLLFPSARRRDVVVVTRTHRQKNSVQCVTLSTSTNTFLYYRGRHACSIAARMGQTWWSTPRRGHQNRR